MLNNIVSNFIPRAAASFISQIYTAPSISDSGTAGGKLDKHNIPLQF